MAVVEETLLDDAARRAASAAWHEERINAITHGAGWLLSLVAAGLLWQASLASTSLQRIAVGIYAASLVVVYACSTLSHAVRRPRLKYWLRIWDQGTIYLLIAGTYTPMLVTGVTPGVRGPALWGVWGCALAGFYAKVGRHHRIEAFSTHSYILLGWGPALLLLPWIDTRQLLWMAAGGLSYTVGTYFLMRDDRNRYYHAIWHLLVILGSGVHFFAILRFAV